MYTVLDGTQYVVAQYMYLIYVLFTNSMFVCLLISAFATIFKKKKFYYRYVQPSAEAVMASNMCKFS